MQQFQNLLNSQFQIFIFTLIGFLCSKLALINKEQRKGLNNLIIYIILPANIVNSFFIKLTPTLLISCISILFVSIGIQIFCLFISSILYIKMSKQKRCILEYATICSNAGFLGNPLVDSIYGSQGLLYASIYLIPQRIIMWSAGISRFTSTTSKEVLKKVLTHPCIIAVEIGMLIMILQFQFPVCVELSIKSLSSCITPLSMFVIGGILADTDYRSFFDKTTILFTILRLILIPFVVFICCYFLQLDSLVICVATILSGMPAGTTTALLASQYNGDEEFAAKCIFTSTIFSLLTIPIWSITMSYILA